MKTMGAKRDKASGGGFTLVELLIVIVLIGLLLALVTGLGLTIRNQNRITSTKQTINQVMTVIQAYYDTTSTWPFSPPALTTTPFDPGGGTGPFVVFGYSDRLVRDLQNVKATKDRLQFIPAGPLGRINVPRDQFDENADPWGEPAAPPARNVNQQRALIAPAILDGWGRPMIYYYRGSMQGKPVLVSSGSDGHFGPRFYFFQNWSGIGWRTSRETDSKFAQDDITTDNSGL